MSRLPLTADEKAAVAVTVSNYSRLVADLQELIEHGWPTHEELVLLYSPKLGDWMFSERRVPNLEGRVHGHPILSGWIKTSPLHAFSNKAAVARTESRWYRLGTEVFEFVEDTDEKIIPTCELR